MMHFDRTKTLHELENADWGLTPNGSNLEKTVRELRRRPLSEFTVEDLRIMIGQNVGLFYLIPLAIERLHIDPLVGGDFYRGDLMKNVLSVSREFWVDNPKLYWEVHELLVEVEILRKTIDEDIMSAASTFRNAESGLPTNQA
jgi:hypothetical protein